MGRTVKISAFLAISFVCMVLALYNTDVRMVLNVSYNGNNIGAVKNREQYNRAVLSVLDCVNGNGVEDVLSDPVFSIVLTKKENISSENKLANKIILNTSEIVAGYKTTVGDSSRVYLCENDSDIVAEYLSNYNVEGAVCKSSFVTELNLEKGYYLYNNIKENGTINDFLKTVPVRTVASVVRDVEISYNTIQIKDSGLTKGTVKVQSEGENGVNRLTEEVTYLDGEETDRVTLSQEVISTPQDRVILVGTSENASVAAAKAAAHSMGFIFPIPKNTLTSTSPFGDGRGHKGYDLVAPYGTPIYAVKAGTVVRASWYSGYGYCVDVDHGNGIVTRYGHASKFCVSVGDKVNQGDMIALVGSTGNSYGNHVHFEVIIGGKRVDPAPYINMD